MFILLPLVNIIFWQPTPAHVLNIDPKLPGSRILSQITVNGIEYVDCTKFSKSGFLKIPTICNW